MLYIIDIALLTQLSRAIIIVAGAFILLSLTNRVISKVIGASNEDRKRIINNRNQVRQYFFVLMNCFCASSKSTKSSCSVL